MGLRALCASLLLEGGEHELEIPEEEAKDLLSGLLQVESDPTDPCPVEGQAYNRCSFVCAKILRS